MGSNLIHDKACGRSAQASGSRHIHTATLKQNAAAVAAIHHFSGKRHNSSRQENVIIEKARYLALRGTARRSSQFFTIGPK